MYAWLNEITSKLRLADIFLWVGFSFLMRKTTEEGEELKYMFAARELAYERTKAFNEEGLAEFVDRYKTSLGKNYNTTEHLQGAGYVCLA